LHFQEPCGSPNAFIDDTVPVLLNEEPNAKTGGVEPKLNEPFSPTVVERGNVTGWPLFSDPNFPVTAEDGKENPVEPIDPLCEAGLELSSFEPLVSAMTAPMPAEVKKENPEELIDPLVAAGPKLAFTYEGWFSTGLGVLFGV